MPTLNIDGKRVTVDDSFLSLSPEQQNATVDEIAGQIGIGAAVPTGDKSRVGRPLYKDQGGDVYSEKTVTFPIDNKWYTFPSVDKSGNIMSEDAVADYVRKNGPVDPITGERFPAFNNLQEAEEFARTRSSGLLKQPLPTTGKAYTGGILPMSRDEQGNVSFDSDAGILGSLKRFVTTPGEVYNNPGPAMKDGDNLTDAGDIIRDGQNVGNPLVDKAALTNRSREMAGWATPISPASRVGHVPREFMRRDKVEPPTAEMLKRVGSEGYDQARDMGVDYSSKYVKNLAGSIKSDLEKDGILAELAPKSFKILEKLDSPPEGSVAPIAGLEAARRSLKNARLDFTNRTEKLAADRIIARLDSFLENPDPQAVVAGPAASAGKLLKEARANYAAGKRSDFLAGKDYSAELRSAAANSGQNIGNTIRSRAASILESDKMRAGFNKSEIAALEQVAKGTATQNTLRYVGNLLGGGGGLGMTVPGAMGAGVGAITGGAPGAAIGATLPPVIGSMAKKGSNALTRRAFNDIAKQTRMRSPLYEQMIRSAEWRDSSAGKRSAMLRALFADMQREKQD